MAADPYKRQLEVVFFDHFLSSTTSTVSFMDIKGPKQIITELRARLCFKLFGMGGPGKGNSAALLEALPTWCSQCQRPFPSMLIAKSLDPPLREKRHPRHLRPTTPLLSPVALTEAAVIGPAARNAAVSKIDSVIRTKSLTKTWKVQRSSSVLTAKPLLSEKKSGVPSFLDFETEKTEICSAMFKTVSSATVSLEPVSLETVKPVSVNLTTLISESVGFEDVDQ